MQKAAKLWNKVRIIRDGGAVREMQFYRGLKQVRYWASQVIHPISQTEGPSELVVSPFLWHWVLQLVVCIRLLWGPGPALGWLLLLSLWIVVSINAILIVLHWGSCHFSHSKAHSRAVKRPHIQTALVFDIIKSAFPILLLAQLSSMGQPTLSLYTTVQLMLNVSQSIIRAKVNCPYDESSSMMLGLLKLWMWITCRKSQGTFNVFGQRHFRGVYVILAVVVMPVVYSQLSQPDTKGMAEIHIMDKLGLALLTLGGPGSCLSSVQMQKERDAEEKQELGKKNRWRELDHLHFPIVAIDRDYSLLYTNKAAEDFFVPVSRGQVLKFAENLAEATVAHRSERRPESLKENIDALFAMLGPQNSKTRPPTTLSCVKSYRHSADSSPERAQTPTYYDVEILEPSSSIKGCLLLAIHKVLHSTQNLLVKVPKLMTALFETPLQALIQTAKELKDKHREHGRKLRPALTGSTASVVTGSASPTHAGITSDRKPLLCEDAKVDSVDLVLSCSHHLKLSLSIVQDFLNRAVGTVPDTSRDTLALEPLCFELADCFRHQAKLQRTRLHFDCSDLRTTAPFASHTFPGIGALKVKQLLACAISVGFLSTPSLEEGVTVKVQILEEKLLFTIVYTISPSATVALSCSGVKDVLLDVCHEIGASLHSIVSLSSRLLACSPEATPTSRTEESIVCELKHSSSASSSLISPRGFPKEEKEEDNQAADAKAGQEEMQKWHLQDIGDMADILNEQEPNQKKQQLAPGNLSAVTFGDLYPMMEARTDRQEDVPDEHMEASFKVPPVFASPKHQLLRHLPLYRPVSYASCNVLVVAPQEKSLKAFAAELPPESGIVLETFPSIELLVESSGDAIYSARATFLLDICSYLPEQLGLLQRHLASRLDPSTEGTAPIMGVRCGSCNQCQRLAKEEGLWGWLHHVYAYPITQHALISTLVLPAVHKPRYNPSFPH